MKQHQLYVRETLLDLGDMLASMLLKAPKFEDKTGYFPHHNLDWKFRELNASLDYNQAKLGELRYLEMKRLTEQMRAQFEADPDNKTGQTREGCKIILAMEDMLRQAKQR